MVKTHRQTQGARLIAARRSVSSILCFIRTSLSFLLAGIAKGIIRIYQLLVSPLLGPRCRFYPSCSSYSLTAIDRYGFFKGSGLAARRICKCHPGHPGGIDYVPEISETAENQVKNPGFASRSIKSSSPLTRHH